MNSCFNSYRRECSSFHVIGIFVSDTFLCELVTLLMSVEPYWTYVVEFCAELLYLRNDTSFLLNKLFQYL